MTGRLSNAAEQQYSLLPGLTYGWAGSGTGSFSTFSLSPAGVTVRDPTGLELISGDGSTLFRLDDDGTANTVIHRHGQPSFWRARSDGGFELLDESGNVVRLASVDAEGWYSFVSLDPTTGTQIAYERDLVVVPGVIISERSDGFAVLGGTTNTSLTFGGLTQNFGNLGNYAFSQVDLQQSDKFVRQLVWSNLQTGGPALTVDVAYDPVTNAVQSATITDNANNFDWSRQDVREVFSNPGSATSSGITVTSTQLDGGERVITLERDAGVTTNDVNNDGVVDQEDADIIFGSGGDDTSGGEGLDILEGGAGQDQLNSDGSKTRYTVTGWRPEVTAGYTFNDVVNNFGEIKVFGEDKVDLTAPILIGSSEGRFGFGDLSEQAKC
jgi:hypothetical protein